MALVEERRPREAWGKRTRDRRRSPRARLGTWVEISTDRGRQRGVARDVSVGGLGVEQVGPALEPGQRLVAEFPLPGIGLPVELEGVVVWCGPPGEGAGIRFVDVDAGLAELLARHASGGLGD